MTLQLIEKNPALFYTQLCMFFLAMKRNSPYFAILGANGEAQCFCGIKTVNTSALAHHFAQIHPNYLPSSADLYKHFTGSGKYYCNFCDYQNSEKFGIGDVVNRFHLFVAHMDEIEQARKKGSFTY